MADDVAPASTEAAPENAAPSLTMEDLLRFSDLLTRFPQEDRVLTLQDATQAYTGDELVWLLQEWIRGGLEAYDAGSHMPVLAPRPQRDLRVAWDFISGVLPDVGMGSSVRVEKVPSRLALYGALKVRPDGIWSFALHPHSQPPLRRVMPDRPLSFPVSLVLKNEHTGAEDRTCLFLHIQRDITAGLVTWADYGHLRFHGFSRTIRDLAENCVRGRAFTGTVGAKLQRPMQIIEIEETLVGGAREPFRGNSADALASAGIDLEGLSLGRKSRFGGKIHDLSLSGAGLPWIGNGARKSGLNGRLSWAFNRAIHQ